MFFLSSLVWFFTVSRCFRFQIDALLWKNLLTIQSDMKVFRKNLSLKNFKPTALKRYIFLKVFHIVKYLYEIFKKNSWIVVNRVLFGLSWPFVCHCAFCTTSIFIHSSQNTITCISFSVLTILLFFYYGTCKTFVHYKRFRLPWINHCFLSKLVSLHTKLKVG